MKYLALIDVPKESNPDYINSGICKEEPKTVYQQLDQFGKNPNPVYDQFNISRMTENPADIGK